MEKNKRVLLAPRQERRDSDEWTQDIYLDGRRVCTVYYQRAHFRDEKPTFQINWSALGSVNVDTARQMRTVLEFAIAVTL